MRSRSSRQHGSVGRRELRLPLTVTLSPQLSLAELAERLGAEVVGDGERMIEGIRPLDQAGPEHLSFLHNPKYVEQAAESPAGAILVENADQLGEYLLGELTTMTEPWRDRIEVGGVGLVIALVFLAPSHSILCSNL